MKKSIKAAIQNIAEFGDTDIFPYSFERHIFRDKPDLLQKALEELHRNLATHLAEYEPDNVNIAEANVNQHVAIIHPKEDLEARYLMYWLSQPTVQEFINDEQKGATRQGFTKAQIQAFEIPVPSLAEQRRIVAELDALQAEVDALKRLQAETAAELDALLPALLDRAFKGKL